MTKEPICELANANGVKDERWRRHAAGCVDCGELLKIVEWMSAAAEKTVPRRPLPAAGFLMVKARVRERRSAAERAARPIYATTIAMGILLAAATVGLLLKAETPVGALMVDAVGLLASYAAAILFGAVIVAAVCGAVAYVGNFSDEK